MERTSPYFLGIARVHLNHLESDPMKHIEAKRVERLVRDFKQVGCSNDDIAHAVPVLVDPTIVSAAVSNANLNPSALYDIKASSPILRFPDAEKFRILYGDHRLQAGKKVLPASDRRWSVLFYDSCISPKAHANVMQGNRQKSVALNGRDLASFLGETDKEVVNVWTSNMSDTHKSTFGQLRNDGDGSLRRTLQNILRYRGLQYKAGNWAPILEMRCREEVEAYLSAIARTWEYILGEDLPPDQLDETTVLELQMYLPAYSSQDCDAILKLFVDNKVFPLVQDVRARENIGRRVLSCKRIVTFSSFFSDFIYLRTCFDGLNALLPATWRKDGRSFEQTFAHNWQPDFPRKDFGYSERSPKGFRECYADLWLFAMREFPYLSDGKASQPLHDRSSTNDHAEPWGSVAFTKAQLAYRASILCGFETEEIEKLKASHPNGLSQSVPSLNSPEVSTNNDALKRRDRSNRPSRTNYGQYRTSLYRIYIDDQAMVERKKHATAYAVARDIVHCCWRSDMERWEHSPEAQPNPKQPPDLGLEQFPEAFNTKAPRPLLTRPHKTGKSKRGGKKRAGINLNQHQKSYEQLMSELREDFVVRDTGTRTSSTPKNEWNAGLRRSACTSLVKEESQHGDDSLGPIDDEHLREDSMHVGPLKYRMKGEPHTTAKSSSSEGSVYSTAERRFQRHPRSVDTGSTSWPRPRHDTATSEFIETRDGDLPAGPALATLPPATQADISKRKSAPAIPDGLEQNVVEEDTHAVAGSSRNDPGNRQTIFPGQDRKLKANITEAVNLLKRPARRIGKPS